MTTYLVPERALPGSTVFPVLQMRTLASQRLGVSPKVNTGILGLATGPWSVTTGYLLVHYQGEKFWSYCCTTVPTPFSKMGFIFSSLVVLYPFMLHLIHLTLTSLVEQPHRVDMMWRGRRCAFSMVSTSLSSPHPSPPSCDLVRTSLRYTASS
jgi:hypothetical protein